MIVVTHPDVAAGGADVNAGPAITPTAAGWRSAHHAVAPFVSVQASRKESASRVPKLEGGSGLQVAGERRTGRSKRPTSATMPASTSAESPMNTGRSSHHAAVLSC